MRTVRLRRTAVLCTVLLTASGAFAENAESAESAKKGGGVLSGLDYEIHGFLETRGGYRTQNDKYEKDMSVMETRMQTDVSGYTDWTDFRVRGDVIGDMVSEQAEFDLREANLSLRPGDNVDLKVGRQILTWGTGDMLFINDLFPKDWQSFFVGRDTEYLKAPSDAVKIGLFGDTANVDFVYTPQFDSDRFISGERVSYWNGNMGSIAGQNAIAHTNKPDRWFRDDEFAVRVYKNVNNYEYALYGYWGYWKSPGGQTGGAGSQMTFPDLNVYGASARGAVGAGIGNVEVGYYESADDSSGKNPLINNSEMRFLVGYSQDVGRDFTAGAQYYVEHMLDYGDYVDNAPAGPLRDRDRSVVTVRLTKLLWNQTLTCSLFTYYSPTDQDAYLRPRVNYKISDDVAVEFGGNVFVGEHKNTFFGQFEDNTNIFAAVRYTF